MSSSYTVTAGETLSAIARRHGLSVAQVLDYNVRLRAHPEGLQPGDVLNLPYGITPIPPAPPNPLLAYVNQVAQTVDRAGFTDAPVDQIVQDCGCPEDDQCQVTAVSGPQLATVGEPATYTVTGLRHGGDEACCTQQIRWRVEVHSCAELNCPSQVIADCAQQPRVFAVSPGTLRIKAVPDGWHCKVRVLPYVTAPDPAISQVTSIRIQPRLLAERDRGNTEDLRFGDVSLDRFRPLYDDAREVCIRNRGALVGAMDPTGLGKLPPVRRAVAAQLCPTFDEFIAMDDAAHFARFQTLVEVIVHTPSLKNNGLGDFCPALCEDIAPRVGAS